MKVLLVEDDQDLAELLSSTLAKHRCAVDWVADGETGFAMTEQWDYDVIMLDVVLPQLDGISLCRKLREQGCATPILMLTAQSTTADIVTGLDAGADDYVTKPFDALQVLARLRALQRRQADKPPDTLLQWEGLTMNPTLLQVAYQGEVLALSPKEYSLLELFLRHPQRVFSRSAVIDQIWSIDDAPSEATVTNLIKDLRRKLKAAGLTTDPIETVHGLGYRLRAESAIAELPPSASISPAPAAALEPAKTPVPIPSVQQVTDRFHATLPERLSGLAAAKVALETQTWTQDVQEQAQAIAHKLAGTLGTFGYSQGSEIAQAIEHLLITSAPLTADQAAQFLQLFDSLQQTLAEPLKLEPPSAPSASASVTTQPILAIALSPNFANRLQNTATDWPLNINVVADPATAQPRVAQTTPAAIILGLNAQTRPDCLTWLATLTQDYPQLPVIILADQDSLEDRVAVAQYNIKRFLTQPIDPKELLAMLTQVLAETATPIATVLIVDDDPLVLTTLSGMLLPQGIQTTCLLHPQQFWPMLKAVNPTLLLLDLEIPGCHGLELCKTVRQDVRFHDLPILVITAKTDAETTRQVFAVGADNVIHKPIDESILLNRVNYHLDRRRLPS